MADFMMVMKGSGNRQDWAPYIERMIATGKFRGGSGLGNGVVVSKRDDRSDQACVVTGFMRFEAETIGEVRELVQGNPVYDAGGEVEVLELIVE